MPAAMLLGPTQALGEIQPAFKTKVTRSGVGGRTPWDPCADDQPPVADPREDNAGEPGSATEFDGHASHDPDVGLGRSGRIRWYEWHFGDGYMARGATVTQNCEIAGDYTVTLIVAPGCDAVSELADPTATVTDMPIYGNNEPPVADAGQDQTGEIDQPVTFDGAGSFNPDASIVSYDWAFGDGSTGSGPTLTHAYGAADTSTLTLTATDDCGAMGTDTMLVTITDPSSPPCSGHQPPLADAGPDQTAKTGQPVSFDGSSSYDPEPPGREGGSIVTWSWNFGDGQTAGGQTATHAHAAAATYMVTLIVTDDGEIAPYNRGGAVEMTRPTGAEPKADRPVAQLRGSIQEDQRIVRKFLL